MVIWESTVGIEIEGDERESERLREEREKYTRNPVSGIGDDPERSDMCRIDERYNMLDPIRSDIAVDELASGYNLRESL